MQKRIESLSELVVARGQSAELLEPVEKALDEVARLVAMPVDRAWTQSVAARGNDGLGATRFDDVDQCIAVVAFVGDDRFGGDVLNQGGALAHIGRLAAGQDQAQRIAQCVNAGVDLGAQPAARAADRLIASVFLAAPAAC